MSAAESTPRWHSRGYLPHYEDKRVLQSLTFRLADSLPQEKLRELEKELSTLPVAEQDLERRKRIEQWLDVGMGCCALRHPRMAEMMEETLWIADDTRYRLIAWCVMPNQVHVVIEPNETLGKIVQSWKSYPGRWAMAHNVELGLGISGGAFWMPDYWDRFIRGTAHLLNVIAYIHANPVTAGLCEKPEDWPWSSARFLRDREAPASPHDHPTP